MDVIVGSIMHVHMDEERTSIDMGDRQAGLLPRLAPGPGSWPLTGLEMSTGLHPPPEPLVPVQHCAPRAHHHGRPCHVDSIGIPVEWPGQPIELRQHPQP